MGAKQSSSGAAASSPASSPTTVDFKVPSDDECYAALGYNNAPLYDKNDDGRSRHLAAACVPVKEMFARIPTPKSIKINKNLTVADWLLENKESGQSIHHFYTLHHSASESITRSHLSSLSFPSSSKSSSTEGRMTPTEISLTIPAVEDSTPIWRDTAIRTIYIWPIEMKSSTSIDNDSIPSMQLLSQYLVRFFPGCIVKVLEHATFDSHLSGQVTRHKVPSSTNHAIAAEDMISFLSHNRPRDGMCIIAVTLLHLFTDGNVNEWVFGQASSMYRVAVISFARYLPSFNDGSSYKPLVNGSTAITSDVYHSLILRRCCKVLAHEICHILLFSHCIYYHCIMNGSNHLKEDDEAPIHLCPICLRKLYHCLKFNPLHRYESLYKLLTTTTSSSSSPIVATPSSVSTSSSISVNPKIQPLVDGQNFKFWSLVNGSIDQKPALVWYKPASGATNAVGTIFWSFTANKKEDACNSIDIGDVTDIFLGRQSSVFQNHACTANSSHCITIMTNRGLSIDIEADHADIVTIWLQGISDQLTASSSSSSSQSSSHLDPTVPPPSSWGAAFRSEIEWLHQRIQFLHHPTSQADIFWPRSPTS